MRTRKDAWFELAYVEKCPQGWDETGACYDEGDINGCVGCRRNGTRVVEYRHVLEPSALSMHSSGVAVRTWRESPERPRNPQKPLAPS